MDDLTYNYKTATNQLTSVDDIVYPANYSEGLDDQQPNNYAYDETGNLTKDNSEGISEIKWNVYGKVKTVKRAIGTGNRPELLFKYSADGNRTVKEVTDIKTGETIKYYYVRDAQGNIMATYILRNDSLFLEEQVMYGSARLGTERENKFLAVKTTGGGSIGIGPAPAYITIAGLLGSHGAAAFQQPKIKYNHILGKKRYELTDWLGNVRVVINDKKIPVDDNSDGTIDYYRADVRSVQDYYPFGMLMPGRSFNSNAYRFGAFGYEGDNEFKGLGKSYTTEFRQYDPRLGRWLSIDPLAQGQPGYSPYKAFFNNPIFWTDPSGGTEEERKKAVAAALAKKGTKYGAAIPKNDFSGGGQFDCSGLVRYSMMQNKAISDPFAGDGKTGSGVNRIKQSATQIKNVNNIEVGNAVVTHSGSHIGIISEVERMDPNNPSKVTQYKFIHAEGGAERGGAGAVTETTINLADEKQSYYEKNIVGFYKWDTPEEESKTDETSKTSDKPYSFSIDASKTVGTPTFPEQEENK